MGEGLESTGFSLSIWGMQGVTERNTLNWLFGVSEERRSDKLALLRLAFMTENSMQLVSMFGCSFVGHRVHGSDTLLESALLHAQ